MHIRLLKSKLHQATVNKARLNYHGSVTIDRELMDAVGLFPYEVIMVGNLATGLRAETYVIEGPAGGKDIQLNGAMARIGQPGDRLIILAYAYLQPEEVPRHRPRVAVLDVKNNIVEQFEGEITAAKG